MTPSTTIGVASTPRVVGSSWFHTRPNSRTVESLTCRRGLKRCSLYVRPYVSQLEESRSAAFRRASSTRSIASLVRHAASVTSSNIGARCLIRERIVHNLLGRLPPAHFYLPCL